MFEPILSRIARIVAENPDQPALIGSDRIYTYGEMMAATRRVQSAFNKRGIDKGDLVAIVLPNGAEFVLSHLALLQHGAVTVPLNPKHSGEDLERLCADVKPAAVISDRGHHGWTRFSELLDTSGDDVPTNEVIESDLAAVVLPPVFPGRPAASN